MDKSRAPKAATVEAIGVLTNALKPTCCRQKQQVDPAASIIITLAFTETTPLAQLPPLLPPPSPPPHRDTHICDFNTCDIRDSGIYVTLCRWTTGCMMKPTPPSLMMTTCKSA